ncbi:hypothetical protein ACWGH8_22035 [Nonomuraea muscovyensis]
MWPEREPDEVIDAWTRVEGDWDLVGDKSGATRMGFASLKSYEIEARFPPTPNRSGRLRSAMPPRW